MEYETLNALRCGGFFTRSPFSVPFTCKGPGDESKLDPSHKVLHFDRGECDKSGQSAATLYGTATELAHVACTCINMSHNAACNRHFVKQKPCFSNFKRTRALTDEISSVIRHDYFENYSNYSSQLHKRRWTKAKQGMIDQEIDDCVPVDASLGKMFEKLEPGHKEITKGRLIQPYLNLATQNRHAAKYYRLQKACARAFRVGGSFSEVITRLEGVDIDVTFASGMNQVGLGGWMNDVVTTFSNPHFYERDGKSWDATMTRRVLLERNRFYGLVDKRLELFSNQGIKIISTAHNRKQRRKLKFLISSTTKSGHNDTSLGNSYSNAMISLEALLKMGVQKARIIAMGDDLLVAIEGDYDFDEMVKIESSYGIIPEAAKFSDWRKTSFVSGVFCQSTDSIIFLPVPGRLLQRLFWTTKSVRRKDIANWRFTVALGLWPLLENVPILRAFLNRHMNVGVCKTGVLTRDQFYRHKRFSDTVGPAEVPAAKWMMERYGISGADIKHAEDYIYGLGADFGIMENEILSHIVSVDNENVCSRRVFDGVLPEFSV